MRQQARIAWLGALALWAGPFGAGAAAPTESIAIQVTSNGWHSEIVVPRAAVPEGALPEVSDFPEARYLAFGWGDAEFYPAPRPTLGMTLRALLGPTPALVHLSGLRAPPARVFPAAEVITIKLTSDGFAKLIEYLDASFERAGAERAGPSAPGLYGFSRFYPATGEFHAFNTCNTWTARALAAAGLAIQADGIVRAEALMTRLRPLGVAVGPPD